MMVELVRVHRAHHQPVVCAGSHARQQVAEIHPALAMFGELARTPHQHGALLLDEGEADVFREALRQWLAVEVVELRLRIEQIHLARRALHEDEDAVLRPGREMRRLRQQRIAQGGCRRGQDGCDQPFFGQQRAQCHQAKAVGRRGQKFAARLSGEMSKRVHRINRG